MAQTDYIVFALVCPMCKASEDEHWEIEHAVIQVTAPRREKREILLATCRLCGYVLQFDAAILLRNSPAPPASAV